MRLNDLAQQVNGSNALASRLLESGQATANQSPPINTNSPTIERQLNRALEASRARVEQNEAAQSRATSARDEVRASDDRLAELQSMVSQAADEELSDSDRDALQERFDTLFAQQDGAQGRLENAVGSNPANSAAPLAASDFGTLDPANLGRGASDQFASLDALRNLDLRSASPAQLEEAGAVIEQAGNRVSESSAMSERRVESLAEQGRVFAGVVDALEGNTPPGAEDDQPSANGESSALQQQARQVNEFIAQLDRQQQQNPLLTPGSLFNFPA